MLDDPATGPGSSRDAAAAEREEGDSYEELVMKRVAAYVQQSQVNKMLIALMITPRSIDLLKGRKKTILSGIHRVDGPGEEGVAVARVDRAAAREGGAAGRLRRPRVRYLDPLQVPRVRFTGDKIKSSTSRFQIPQMDCL